MFIAADLDNRRQAEKKEKKKRKSEADDGEPEKKKKKKDKKYAIMSPHLWRNTAPTYERGTH